MAVKSGLEQEDLAPELGSRELLFGYMIRKRLIVRYVRSERSSLQISRCQKVAGSFESENRDQKMMKRV